MTEINILPSVKNREKDFFYKNGDKIVFWDGKYLKCEHKKRKTVCKECGGSSICEHNKQKSKCKECGGSSICEHNKQKSKCVECGGSGICEHNKRKSRCVECGGSGICEHKRIRNVCKECGGSSICEHNKQKSQCKECGGSSICEHNKIRSRCKECGGSQICEHNRQKSHCSTCSTNRKNFCQICNSVYIKGCTYSPLCFRCHCLSHPDEPIPRRYKLKQHYIYDKIKEVYFDFEYDKTISGGCSNKRPDFLFDKLTHCVIVEIDEDQHTNYNTSCDEVRTMSMFTDLGNRPLIMIRFNPDEYNHNISCFSFDEKNNIIINEDEFKNRIEMLLDTIQFHLDNIPLKELNEIKLFFNE